MKKFITLLSIVWSGVAFGQSQNDTIYTKDKIFDSYGSQISPRGINLY